MADVKRLRYFNGQFLKENDFSDEQAYLVQLERDHARLMHTPGICDGLDIAFPSGVEPRTVSIPSGTAYDRLGRRISFTGPFDPQLQAETGNELFITIRYNEAPSDSVTDTGTPGFTRMTEAPEISVLPTAPGDPTLDLLLARVVRNGAGIITAVDRSAVLRAGVKAGDLALNSLNVTGPTTLTGTASVSGTLAVAGNITVTGTVDGRDVSADGTALTAHLAATNNPHQTTAAQINAVPTGGGVMTGDLRINAALGVNTAPLHRLHVVAGDEGDLQTTGALFAASTTAATTGGTIALSSSADSTGSAAVTGLSASAGTGGAGTGEKVAVTASALNTGTGAAATRAYLGTARDDTGTGPVSGLAVQATGSRAGTKTAVEAAATGANGEKLGGSFAAVTSANVNVLTRGVVIVANSQSNSVGSGDTYGVYSTVSGTGTATKVAIYGNALVGSGTRWAGFFDGNVNVNGTISTSGTKPFRIDHPLDPLNKILQHVAAESPEELCMYRGKVKLNRNGTGKVTMPDYFAALTKEDEATVQLTAIGRKASVASYEWNEKHTGFTVFGEPEGEVSYLVLAQRDDPSVHVVRRPVEEEKDESSKGKLLLPAAYPELAAKHSAKNTTVPSPAALAEQTTQQILSRLDERR